MTSVELEGEDAAIIVRANGDFELYTPKCDNSDDKVGQPTIVVAALARILAKRELLDEIISDMVAEADEDASHNTIN